LSSSCFYICCFRGAVLNAVCVLFPTCRATVMRLLGFNVAPSAGVRCFLREGVGVHRLRACCCLCSR
jgi:hypothetical protein